MPLSGLTTIAVALGFALLSPPMWRSSAIVVAADHSMLRRLTTPFAPLLDAEAELKGLEARLVSRERLVALVKGAGLVDQLDANRSSVERLWADAAAKVVAPPTELERLDEAVDVLRRRTHVERHGRHVRLSSDWVDPETALDLARAQVEALTHGLAEREPGLAARALAATDARLEEAQNDNAQRLANRMRSQPEPDTSALTEGRARVEALKQRATEEHLELDVTRSPNAPRYFVLNPPQRPREPVSVAPLEWALLCLAVGLLSAVVGPLVLELASRPPVEGRSVAVSPALGLAAMVGLAVLQGVGVGTADGDAVVAFTPLGWAVTLWLVWVLPLKWSLLALLFAAMTCDDPSDRAYAGRWQSPLFDIGKALFTNVAYFTGFELRLMGLTVVMLVRTMLGFQVDPMGGLAPRPLRQAVLLSLGTVVVLLMLGLVRGGEFRQALWQFRFLLMLPLIATLAMQAFEFPRDLRSLGLVLVAGSLVKAGLGIYFMQVVAPTLAHFPPHTSGHNDTMLLTTAALLPLILLWEEPTIARVVLALVWLPAVAFAIRYNDRRIAYVDLVACALVLVLISPRHRVKRLAMRAGVMAAPLVALYLAVGWNQPNVRVFGLAQTIRSLVAPVEGSKDESSNSERGIENYNLIKSWAANPIVGQGFGHAFAEHAPSNDFSQSNFGHIGHNSILWLLWIGGVLGFTGVLLHIGVAAFFVGRTLRRLEAPNERAALLIATSILIIYLSQCFGDMGTQSIEIAFFVGVALAIIGRLATRAGAWNEPSVQT